MISLTLHEKKAHGTESFPAEYYYVDSLHPRFMMPFHWHREWEIIHVIHGNIRFTVGNEEYPASEGDFLIIPEGVIHGGEPMSPECVYECLVFSLPGLFSGSIELSRLISPFVKLERIPEIIYRFSENETFYTPMKNAMKACADVYSAPSGPDCSKLIMICNIGYLFGLIMEHGTFFNESDNINAVQKYTRIKPVLEYIGKNFASTISLETLSSLAGLNPKYFCQIFREITHRTPIDYLIFYRIEQACVLLSTTDLSVTEIGMQCGFNDSGYFTRQFKNVTGTTPLNYRKAKG